MSVEQFGTCEELYAAFDLEQTALWAEAAAQFVPEDVLAMASGGSVPTGLPASHTLTQERGVAEDDRVATDGRWLYTLDREGLVIVDLAAVPVGGSTREVYARVGLDAEPLGLYLDGDRVIVVGRGLTREFRGDSTLVAVVDVHDRDQPEIVSERWTPGVLRESRLQGDQLVLVTTAPVLSGGFVAGIDPTRARESSDPGIWLPPGVGCADVWVDFGQDRSDLTTVSTLDLAKSGADFRGTSLLGSVGIVYADADTVWIGVPEGDGTALHRVEVGGHPKITDAIVVPGTIPSRWAISEDAGVLRVVSEQNAESRVTTWDASGAVLGQIVGLAPGEQLMTARFDGDLVYVVTYAVPQGDPLFVVALHDPRAPALIGELHVPGWSDLLLPIPGHRLLAVGMDFGDGGFERATVSLFEVGAEGPKLLDREFLAAHDTDARFDLHAWAWANGWLALPTRKGIEVARVNADGLVPEALIAAPRGARPADRAVIVGDVVYGTSDKGRRTDTWSEAVSP